MTATATTTGRAAHSTAHARLTGSTSTASAHHSARSPAYNQPATNAPASACTPNIPAPDDEACPIAIPAIGAEAAPEAPLEATEATEGVAQLNTRCSPN